MCLQQQRFIVSSLKIRSPNSRWWPGYHHLRTTTSRSLTYGGHRLPISAFIYWRRGGHVGICGGQRSTYLRCHSSGAIILCFETESSPCSLGFSDSATPTARPAPRIQLSLSRPSYPPHTLGSKMRVATLRFRWFCCLLFTFVLGIQNSGPRTCTAGSSPTKNHPSSPDAAFTGLGACTVTCF